MSLTIRSAFEIAAPCAKAWAVLTDIERAAPCFPGATLTGRRDDGSWLGAFNVKLGPMSFKFAGSFAFVSLDQAGGHATVKADGADVKGRGGANARIEIQVLPVSDGSTSTRVELVSNVDLSGGVAQYGRGAGMIEALSQQLVDQFARNLGAAIAVSTATSEPAAAAAAPSPEPTMTSAPSAEVATTPRAQPAASAPPLDAGRLFWKTLVAAVRRWLGLTKSTRTP